MISTSHNCEGAVGFKIVLLIVLLSLFTIFILQNTQVVIIKFLFWHMELSRVIMLLGALFIGILIGFLIRKASDRKTTDKEKSF